MTRVDQFESVFRSASKEVYRPTGLELGHVHIVCDLEGQAAVDFTTSLQHFLSVLGKETRWTTADPSGARDLGRLLDEINQDEPDLVCTYRNLFSESWRYPFSLGEQVDVLTQVAPCPVLVLPHPAAEPDARWQKNGTQEVLAMGGHLSGDHSLVDWGLHFTQAGGTLRIAHIEDDLTFARYIDAISKIESIDTEDARQTILMQLMKEPQDYIESASRAVAETQKLVRIESDVRLGHRLSEYRRLLEEHTVDLLVMHTKDDDQLAMHGLAYPLAVELREIPLLLL